MWAQLNTIRAKEGALDELVAVMQLLQDTEQPDSGLLRTIVMQDQKDPARFFTFVLFENEESARARENDSRREDGLKEVRARLAEILDGPPEFTDLTVVFDAVRGQ